MKLTPLDIQHHEFKKKGQRYEAAEVDSFIELIRLDYEDALRQLEQFRDRNRQLEAQLSEMHQNERTLKDAIISAQRVMEELKTNARMEAEIILAEARMDGEKITEQARRDVERILFEITELKRQRAQLDAQLRAVIHAHSQLIEATTDRAKEDDAESSKIKVFGARS